MISIFEEKFIFRALIFFMKSTNSNTSRIDSNVSIGELLIRAQKLAITIVPCTSKAADIDVDGDIIAHTVARAYMFKYYRGIKSDYVDDFIAYFVILFEQLWNLNLKEQKMIQIEEEEFIEDDDDEEEDEEEEDEEEDEKEVLEEERKI